MKITDKIFQKRGFLPYKNILLIWFLQIFSSSEFMENPSVIGCRRAQRQNGARGELDDTKNKNDNKGQFQIRKTEIFIEKIGMTCLKQDIRKHRNKKI